MPDTPLTYGDLGAALMQSAPNLGAMPALGAGVLGSTYKKPVYKDFPSIIRKWYPTGSRFICNPPPMDTDNDTVILVYNLAKAEALLLTDEWTVCDDAEYEPGEFRAFRRDSENYIVTESIGFFTRYVLATNAAKELNLLNKEDRVKLFIEILNKDAVGLSYGLTYNTDIRGIAWEAQEK